MKYCTKCPTRAPDSADKCRTCDGPLLRYEDLRASDLEKISTDCCPSPVCAELVAPPQKYFCKACGEPLTPISLDVWIKKVLEPTFAKDPRDLLASRPPSLFRRADEMGLEPREVRNAIAKFIVTRAGVDQSEVNEWVKAATAVLMSRESDLEHLKGYARKLAGDRRIAPDFANRMLDSLVEASHKAKLPSQNRTSNQSSPHPPQEVATGPDNNDESTKTKPFIYRSPNGTWTSGVNQSETSQGRYTSETKSHQSGEKHQSGSSESEGSGTNGFDTGAQANKNSKRFNGKESDTGIAPRRSRLSLYVVLVVIVFFAGLMIMIVLPRSSPQPTPTPLLPTPTPVASPVESSIPEGMVAIKAGEFYMGSDHGNEDEGPPHPESVEAFLIDKYEVSCDDYQKCVDQGDCESPARWDNNHYPLGTGKRPVTSITFQDAAKYCSKQGKRLPTEIEWEYAARGKERNRIYPWGAQWMPQRANVKSEGLMEVGSYKQRDDPELYDLIGNAQEWTSSKWVDYPGTKAPRGRLNEDDNVRVIRGGSYKRDPRTATSRDVLEINKPKKYYVETGFRCARDGSN